MATIEEIEDLVRHPGWKQLLELLETRKAKIIEELLTASDPQRMIRLQVAVAELEGLKKLPTQLIEQEKLSRRNHE